MGRLKLFRIWRELLVLSVYHLRLVCFILIRRNSFIILGVRRLLIIWIKVQAYFSDIFKANIRRNWTRFTIIKIIYKFQKLKIKNKPKKYSSKYKWKKWSAHKYNNRKKKVIIIMYLMCRIWMRLEVYRRVISSFLMGGRRRIRRFYSIILKDCIVNCKVWLMK